MCGIAGFYGIKALCAEADDLLSRMTATLTHRGPDGSGRRLGLSRFQPYQQVQGLSSFEHWLARWRPVS